MSVQKVYIKNALETIVTEEAKIQFTQIDRAKRKEIDLSEVIAFALNRLPPMYASSDRGWLHQRKRANIEHRRQIITQLHQAFMRVGNNPLVKVSPLPLYELERPGYCLARLREILRRPDLTWKEIPAIVKESVGGKTGSMEHLSAYDRRRILETKNFLSKSRVQRADIYKEQKIDPIEVQEFDSYMVTAEYSFVNVLERPVTQIAEKNMQRMAHNLARQVPLEDVVVYTLNRLPSMYATNLQGFQQQRAKVREELFNDISTKVIEAILTLSKTPRRMVGPLPCVKFEREHEQAIENLKEIFEDENLTCGLAVELVEKAVVGTSFSNRMKSLRATLLGELINALNLPIDRHGLSLEHEEKEGHLVFKTSQQDTFWAIIDNPEIIARIVLELFPESSSMELQYQRLPFPLILTKYEMEEEVIHSFERESLEITKIIA